MNAERSSINAGPSRAGSCRPGRSFESRFKPGRHAPILLSWLFAFAFVFHCACSNLISSAQSQPATNPSTQSVEFSASSPYRGWFSKLADSDARIREQAQVELMGMNAGELPAFHRLVETSRPLAPSQAAVLQDIVEHVFLQSAGYDGANGSTNALGSDGPYFMGVNWPPDARLR